MDRAFEILKDGFVALTGAGISTDSGIPDYRGPDSVARMPMTFQDFLSGAEARQRYWARSHIGWSRMGQAAPNAGHQALARLEQAVTLQLLITQNVDGLHEAAGSQRLVPLHGRISEVICLDCREVTDREELHLRLQVLNPTWLTQHVGVESRPDGDVDLEETADFVVPECTVCGGVLKPHVVFFGENAPRDKVASCYEAVERAPALLVAGSSLTVMSGLRFVRAAMKWRKPIVIVNRGATRGDDIATVKIDAGTSEWLVELAAALGSGLADEDVRGDVPVDLSGLPAAPDQ